MDFLLIALENKFSDIVYTKGKPCHAERSEASQCKISEMFGCAQHDNEMQGNFVYAVLIHYFLSLVHTCQQAQARINHRTETDNAIPLLERGGEPTMTQLFRVGDRVRITRPRAGLMRGSRGTIRQVFQTGEFYDVRFDSELLPRLVHSSDLEAAAPAQQARAVGDG